MSASRTARMVAHFRGLASERWPALAVDPWALALGGDDGASWARDYEHAHPHMALYMAVRTAAFDDEVRRSIDRGATQVVILGAGLDTRAARLAARGVRFFEVDREETQQEKRRRLEGLEGYPIDAATYVRCDFEHERFLDRLLDAGFEREARTVIVWEGVVYYLTEDAIRTTLRAIASGCEQGSRVAMDLVGKRFVSGAIDDARDARARELVAEMGEPLRFGTDDVLPLLYQEGFRHVETTRFDELCLTYTGTYERERKMRFQSLAVASVAPPPRPGAMS